MLLSINKIFVIIFLVFFLLEAQVVNLSATTFQMGSNTGEPDERPVHNVNLSQFSIDIYEVTNAQYDSCIKAGRCSPAHYEDGKCFIWTSKGFTKIIIPIKYRHPDLPVTCVSWYQANQYCKYKGKRLPTEAQWEYAAGGGKDILYSWGNDKPTSNNCGISNDGPKKVGSFKPNSFGIYDMTGNVWEWVFDNYSADYYSVSEEKDPLGPRVGQYHVIRGGGWYSNYKQLRIRNRHWFDPNYGEASIGFRCAK